MKAGQLFSVRIPVAVFFLATLLAGCSASKAPTVGQQPPELSVLDLHDEPVRLTDYRGKVVLLNFWIGGCGPCLAEMPLFEDIYRKYSPNDLAVLAVNMGEGKEAVEATIKRVEVSYPVVIDQLEITATKYGVIAVPTSFVVDRTGVLRSKILGGVGKALLEKEIGAWL